MGPTLAPMPVVESRRMKFVPAWTVKTPVLVTQSVLLSPQTYCIENGLQGCNGEPPLGLAGRACQYTCVYLVSRPRVFRGRSLEYEPV